MKNFLKLVGVCLISVVISACGGGGESSPPAQTSGSISGTTVPGAIVGINCYVSINAPCAGASSTTIADSNGRYSFLGITQMGQYVVYASKPGYKSELAGTCGFSSGGFFGCGYDIPLSPITPITVTTGLDFTTFGFIHDLYCDVASVCVIGAKTQIYGSLYQWGYGPSYLSMELSSTHDILAVSMTTSSGGVNRMDGVICGVSSDVYKYGRWHYRCSDYFGITFNRVAGTISFDRTPLYHLLDGGTAYGASYPYVSGAVSGSSATGTLTFAPF